MDDSVAWCESVIYCFAFMSWRGSPMGPLPDYPEDQHSRPGLRTIIDACPYPLLGDSKTAWFRHEIRSDRLAAVAGRGHVDVRAVTRNVSGRAAP
jgi:hypothetical protein